VSLNVGRTKLVTSLKHLRGRWERVQRDWNDPVRREFEQQFVDPLEGKIRAAVNAMEHMHDLATKARRDCE
jgi:hypothetical protein